MDDVDMWPDLALIYNLATPFSVWVVVRNVVCFQPAAVPLHATSIQVLHLRNLPWECTEEELIELGKPFGRVVNTKCNVGANRNQAFIEFAELNQAIAMISYYASSSEPAQVRGKTVYLQYSNRQEIVNNKTTADVAGNVLLVTIEGDDARLVSIDVLHLVSNQASSSRTQSNANLYAI
ncbi:hypothetical protein BUALT_Bualt01G0168700 [Buddleja alternifolia]|uniref:RRM domain-containing protein n=1 Tax=Buddleja alternifolia TaxID=168488 RepID=A0AAV6Y7S0_9LAMI|nr:hypothetical protein BUALT_Bualt01G0168700 [Buddleja alternifolia]